jgi:hypothetical protein
MRSQNVRDVSSAGGVSTSSSGLLGKATVEATADASKNASVEATADESKNESKNESENASVDATATGAYQAYF